MSPVLGVGHKGVVSVPSNTDSHAQVGCTLYSCSDSTIADCSLGTLDGCVCVCVCVCGYVCGYVCVCVGGWVCARVNGYKSHECYTNNKTMQGMREGY